MKPIITASEYASESAGPRPPVLLDVRWQLGGPHGRPDYEAGHLPGAVFVDLDAELAGPAGSGGRHPLPDPEEFGAVMRRAGVSRDTPVVVYDGGQGWAAARAWWLLRWTGHEDVRVLDGGLAAWPGSSRRRSRPRPRAISGPFPARCRCWTRTRRRHWPARVCCSTPAPPSATGAMWSRSTGWAATSRAPCRPRPPRTRGGRPVPGRAGAGGALRGLGAGRADEVGVYCGSGVSGAHEVLALAIAGIPAALYAGSWSEWSGDASRPVATGPEPR